jgi:hypothetical protein
MAKAISQRQFERVMSEFNKISEWVSKNFSEVTFRVEFNDDSQNPVDPAFRIKTRLMTTKMMDLNDQLLRKHEFVIRSVIWEDAILMEKWINNLYPSITSSISDLINNWYARKKVEGTAQ